VLSEAPFSLASTAAITARNLPKGKTISWRVCRGFVR